MLGDTERCNSLSHVSCVSTTGKPNQARQLCQEQYLWYFKRSTTDAGAYLVHSVSLASCETDLCNPHVGGCLEKHGRGCVAQ